jgi:hypothetical protein
MSNNLYTSMRIFCGLAGIGGSFSIITLRAGGGMTRPGMVITLPCNGCGGGGGHSRITIGGGVGALALG